MNWLADLVWSLVGWLFMPSASAGGAQLSANGLAFIKRHEGWRERAYKDLGGKYTIGYGHLIVPGDGLGPLSVITPAQGEAILLRDVQTAVNAVRSTIKVPVSQNQFDAMVSLAFNIGAAGFAGSSVAKLVNAGNPGGAGVAWVQNWTTAGGDPTALLSRRQDERKLFETY